MRALVRAAAGASFHTDDRRIISSSGSSSDTSNSNSPVDGPNCHTSGASYRPEHRRVRDRSITEGDVPPRCAHGASGRDRNRSANEGGILAHHPCGASSSPDHRRDSQLELLREPLEFNHLLGTGIRYTSELLLGLGIRYTSGVL